MHFTISYLYDLDYLQSDEERFFFKYFLLNCKNQTLLAKRPRSALFNLHRYFCLGKTMYTSTLLSHLNLTINYSKNSRKLGIQQKHYTK